MFHGAGHLVEPAPLGAYSDAWKKWGMECLPMILGEWQTEVKESAAALFAVIKRLVHDGFVERKKKQLIPTGDGAYAVLGKGATYIPPNEYEFALQNLERGLLYAETALSKEIFEILSYYRIMRDIAEGNN